MKNASDKLLKKQADMTDYISDCRVVLAECRMDSLEEGRAQGIKLGIEKGREEERDKILQKLRESGYGYAASSLVSV